MINFGKEETKTTEVALANEMGGQVQTLEVSNEHKQYLRSLPEVQDLTSEINIQDMNSIINFGQKSSEGISKVSDELLASMKSVKAGEVSEMMNALAKVMDQFDSKELQNTKKAGGFLNKIFKSAQDVLDKMFEKYENMGKEIDEVAIILKKYEMDIKKSNDALRKLGEANVKFFNDLENYVVAGEIAMEEVDTYIAQFSSDSTISQEEKDMMIQSLTAAKDMLNQRIYDLATTEAVAIQTCVMLQNMMMSNFNLMRKINTSFIITLPVFKQALVQAVMLKRQEIQSKSMQMLDDKTNELLKRNATNSVNQSLEIARMTSNSSIKIDTLEQNHQIIMQGIQDVKAIQEESRIKIADGMKKLESMNEEMKKSVVK